ncbi:glycosyltransferase family 4 protein [Humisphaera borealis]|uniref:Glycosyltransferase family 4 protein n=1 Tax=Humisphaera borealis TaxID=2807512 RepID=A0A7M2WQZ5_9BACT|nr:glycosyltransferase family 4 protein [Humisphaera borealis]QOV87664.1 glycosyltransferase family 4 protein [Humisphaera borealis]
MKRVLILANNLRQASYRVRVEALLPLLRDRGFQITVGLRKTNPITTWRLLASAGAYDTVVLQRKMLEGWEARVLRKAAKRVIYDIDDALMYFNRPVSWHSKLRTRLRFRATVRAVDHVVAGNEYLADIFRREGLAATVLPTVVDPSRYAVKQHAETTTPRLVWIGSRSTLQYVRGQLPALQAAAERTAGLRLLTIADQTLADAPLPIDHEPWSAETEAAALVRGDIGIAPTPTDPWTLGKCGFKIVQYMAAGLPVVASPVGANAELVREGVTGFLPTSAAEWADAIRRLATDVDLRRQMGEAGRRRVEEQFCLEKVADIWATLL